MDDDQLEKLMEILDKLGWSVAYISRSENDDIADADGLVIGTTEYIEKLLGADNEEDDKIPTPVADA